MVVGVGHAREKPTIQAQCNYLERFVGAIGRAVLRRPLDDPHSAQYAEYRSCALALELQKLHSQAGYLAVIHKSVRVEIFRVIGLYTIVTGRRSLTPRRKENRSSLRLCVKLAF